MGVSVREEAEVASREGTFREDAGTVDPEGFIVPSIGLVDHALYFTTAPDVLAKTREVIDGDRLELPGAVIVWDETIGRRTGSKAVPGSWWATAGSVTMSIVFDAASVSGDLHRSAVDAVLEAISSFSPDVAPWHDGGGLVTIAGQPLAQVDHVTHAGAEIVVVRVHAATDFTKAPAAVREGHTALVDHIDVSALPLGEAATLPNSLSQAIMAEVPQALGW